MNSSAACHVDFDRALAVRRIHFWIGVVAGSMIFGWVVFAKLIAPSLLESAYHGNGLTLLSRIILEPGDPLEELLKGWSFVAEGVVLAGLAFWLMAWAMTHPAFFRKYVGEATPGTLGAIRMLTCTILLTSALWENLPSSALLPREMINPSGVIRLLYLFPIGFEKFVASENSLGILQGTTIVLLLMGAIGWKTRFAVPLGALCYLLMGGILRQYAWFYHTGVVPFYVLAVLSFTPCGDGWSVDRLLKILTGQTVAPAHQTAPVYGWSRYACWAVIALPYVAAGMSKLRNGGFFWWNANNMREILYRDSLNPMQFDWGLSLWLSPAPDIVFALLGLAAIIGELTFGAVLLFRTARLYLPGVMLLMHIGIAFLQNVLFFDLILLQLVFYDFTEMRRAVGKRLTATRGPIEILYDGLCPFCRRSVRLLSRFDLFERFRWIDFRELNLGIYNRSHGLNLSEGDLKEQMVVVSKGKAYSGFYGYRVIAGAVPAFWPIVPALFFPGVSWMGVKAYGLVARNRLKLVSCDSECGKSSSEKDSFSVPRQAVTPLRTFGPPIAISSVAAFLLFCWFCRVEHFPFTAMQMYTQPGSGAVTYYKVLAHRESGDISRAYLERAIGAMADGRYRKVVRMCFDPQQVHVCAKFLEACGVAYNKEPRPGEKVTQFEIQKWVWNFRSKPLNPDYGELVDRFTFPVV